MLTRLEELETQAIPEMVKRGKQLWDGNVCINFAAEFLECEIYLSLPFGFLSVYEVVRLAEADKICTHRAQDRRRWRGSVENPQKGEIVRSGGLQDRRDRPWRHSFE